MRLHCFIGNFNFSSRFLNVFDKEVIYQITTVLKFKPGERIILSDGILNEALAEIEQMSNKYSGLKL